MYKRQEDYVLLSNGTWKLVEAMDYEYDCENRWIKRTRANGRITEREMMCCGPLWERYEDGILTTYSYNTARQLVEVIRSATETTPEMIMSSFLSCSGQMDYLRPASMAYSSLKRF